MSEAVDDRPEGDRAIVSYKRLLKSYLDRRPSGTRQRIATALGTHKSFVSQITSPNYRVPLPAQHVATIMKICHFSPEERRAFVEAYRKAHPSQLLMPEEGSEADHQVVQIELPRFPNAKRQKEVADAIRDMATRMIALAQADEQ